MTIKVTITQEDGERDNFAHVATFAIDVYGNKIRNTITQLKPGEPFEGYLYNGQELRVYETDKELPN